MTIDFQSRAAGVDIEGLEVAFGERRVFDGLSCQFPAGEISVILGSSGGGKTTLLRAICGLLRPDKGSVRVDGLEVTSLTTPQLRDFRRRIGMLFQGGALLDSMTVFDNAALPLREHTPLREAQIAERVHQQFEAVGLKDVDRLLPGQLSGGMVKRAALARAMILEPQILLCDEPFSGLDPIAVRVIEELLVELNERVGVTTILTSHHISATMRIADQVAFLVDGSALSGSLEQFRTSHDRRVTAFLDAATPPPAEQMRGARPA